MTHDHGAEIMEAITTSAHHKTDKRDILQRAFSLLLFSVFVVVDLLALVTGTSSYGSLTKMQQANDDRIMSLGPIISAVRANDAENSVQQSDDAPETPALVLAHSDSEGTYETRIYLYEGKILQEYALAGSPYTPEKATTLAESSTFDFNYSDGLLTISTDAGEAKIALRNLQGGA